MNEVEGSSRKQAGKLLYFINTFQTWMDFIDSSLKINSLYDL
jgi:hypothetical protein